MVGRPMGRRRSQDAAGFRSMPVHDQDASSFRTMPVRDQDATGFRGVSAHDQDASGFRSLPEEGRPGRFAPLAASSSAPSSMTTTEIHSQVMKPATAPNEP